MLRFSVSLGMLFTDAPLRERFSRARDAGFRAVEMFWPDELSFTDIAAAQRDAGVDVALFNMYEGDYAKGERGFAGDPSQRERWRGKLDAALELAERVGCPRINVLAGDTLAHESRTAQMRCLVENLRWAAPRAARQGVSLLIEPLNGVTHPSYLCPRTVDVLGVIDEVGATNLAVQYDCYQAQRGEGDIVATLRAHISRIGHVQVADAPDRFEPGTGELNFPYILAELERVGYGGYVGLEYRSRPDADPFSWLPRSSRG